MKAILSKAICLAFCVIHAHSENTKLKDLFAWKTVDYAWKNPADRAAAIEKGEFIPINNLPLGLEVWKDKLFITVPRWKSGVVSTLNYVKLNVDDICDPPPTEPATTAPPTDPSTDPTTDPTTDPITDPTDPTTDPTTNPTTNPTTDPITDPTTDPTDPDTIFPPVVNLTTLPPFVIDEITVTAPGAPTLLPATTLAVTDPTVTILGRARHRSQRGKKVKENNEEEVKKKKKNKGENKAEKVEEPKSEPEKVEPEVKPEKKPKNDKNGKNNGKEKDEKKGKKKKKKCKDDCKDDCKKKCKDDCKKKCKDDCKKKCKHDCKKNCKDDCKKKCKDDCKDKCKEDCKDKCKEDCKDKCKEDCKKNCKDDCKKNCKDDCKKKCKDDCKKNCKEDCKKNCKDDCKDKCKEDCKDKCKEDCKDKCKEDCKKNCKDDCKDKCKEDCKNNCKDDCKDECKKNCKDDCYDDCKGDCDDDCEDDCDDDCEDDCDDDCGDDCNDDCNDDCDDDPTPAPTTAPPADATTATPDPCEPRSPALIPYPSFEANRVVPENKDGSSITSVFRVKADACDRLWVMDTGIADILGETVVASKPRILIYNLNDDTLIRSYELKDTDSKADSFYANIVVDTDASNCDKAFAYIPDLGGYAIVVYDYAKNDSWRIKHNYFHFDPLKGNMTVGGVNFQWTDGVFSIALTKPKEDGSRTAYFHSLASTKEFKVDTKTLQTQDTNKISFYDFDLVGDRGDDSQSSASYIQENTGVMFYTQLQRDGVYCWNTNKPLIEENLVEVASDNETMIFTNDLKVDAKDRLWVLTDRLPTFIYKGLGEDEYNYHIFTGAVDEIIAGTKCAP